MLPNSIARIESPLRYDGYCKRPSFSYTPGDLQAFKDGDGTKGYEHHFYNNWINDFEGHYIVWCLMGGSGTSYGLNGDPREHMYDCEEKTPNDCHHFQHDEHKEILDTLSKLVESMVTHPQEEGCEASIFYGRKDSSSVSKGLVDLIKGRFARTHRFLASAMGVFMHSPFDHASPSFPSDPEDRKPGPLVPVDHYDHVKPFFEAMMRTAAALDPWTDDPFGDCGHIPDLKNAVDHADELVSKLIAMLGSKVKDFTWSPVEVGKCKAVSQKTLDALLAEWNLRIMPAAGDLFARPDADVNPYCAMRIMGFVLGFVIVLCCRVESALSGLMLLARNFVGIMRKSPAQHYVTDSEACLVCIHTDLIWMYFITDKSKEGFKVIRRHLNSRTVPPPFPCLNLERCLYLSDEQRARTVDMFREAIFRMGGPEVVQEPLDISLASISHEQDPRNIRRVVNLVVAAHVLGPSSETGYDKLNHRDKTFLYDSPLFAPAKIMIQHLSRFAKEFAMQTILMDNFLRELSETDLFQALEKGLHGADTYVRGGTNGRLKTFFKGVYLDIFDNFKPCPHRGMEHTRLALQGRLVILLHELWLTMDNDNHAFDWGNCDLLKDAGKDGPFWSRVLEGIDPSKFFIIDTPENTPVIPFNGSFKVTYGDVSFPLNTCSHCYMPGMPTCKKTTTYHLSNHTDRHLFALHFHNHILTVYVNDMWCSGPGECIRGATAHQPARMYTALAAKDG